MAITHAAVKAHGEKGYYTEWNAPHVVDDDSKPKNNTTLIVAASNSLDTTRADYVCDGIDDQEEINDALNALAAHGGRVSLLDGTYQITNSIIIPNSHVTLVGLGSNTTIQTTAAIRIIEALGRFDIIVKDLTLVGMAIANPANIGIYLHRCGRSVIDNIRVTACGGDAIRLTGIAKEDLYLKITKCTIYTNFEDGINSRFNSGTSFINNHIYANLHHGIRIRDQDNCIISNNLIEDNDGMNTASFDGIILSSNSGNNSITSNRCHDNDRDEIRIHDNTCDRNTILSNHCLGADHVAAVVDNGTNTLPNGAMGTNNLALDDHNVIA